MVDGRWKLEGRSVDALAVSFLLWSSELEIAGE